MTGTETKGQANSHQPCKVVWSGLSPPTPCLPCVRGGAERMRSGGVAGSVQEKAACSRQPVPIRHLQPLSQTLRVCQLPFSIAGVSAETPLRHRKAGRARSDGRNHVPPVNPLFLDKGREAKANKTKTPASKSRCLLVRPTGVEPAAFRVGVIRPPNRKLLRHSSLIGIAQILGILKKNLGSLAGQGSRGFLW